MAKVYKMAVFFSVFIFVTKTLIFFKTTHFFDQLAAIGGPPEGADATPAHQPGL